MTLSQAQPARSSECAGSAFEVHAIDLTNEPNWRRVRSSAVEADGPDGKSAECLASALGFEFYRTSSSTEVPIEAMRVIVHTHSDPLEIGRVETRRRRGGPVRRVSVPAVNPKYGELIVVIGPLGADVFASHRAWEASVEPVLLIVAQFARIFLVEQQFQCLQDQASSDHRHAVSAGLYSLREQKRLALTSCDVRDLVSDWTYFSGPRADPCRSCTSEETLETYVALAEELDIDGWTEGIDAIADDVAQTYEAISEKLLHYRFFAWSMATEIVIMGMIAGLLVHW